MPYQRRKNGLRIKVIDCLPVMLSPSSPTCQLPSQQSSKNSNILQLHKCSIETGHEIAKVPLLFNRKSLRLEYEQSINTAGIYACHSSLKLHTKFLSMTFHIDHYFGCNANCIYTNNLLQPFKHFYKSKILTGMKSSASTMNARNEVNC